ncbi:MAG: hypothetical protein JKY70_00185 [Mucilaginibacter sp.]|nr:hypothetical protein [Mucilaginibacter sp.]
MASDTFNDHLNRLKQQTDELRETLAMFRSNYTSLQFGMSRLENDLKKSREQLERLTENKNADATVIQMNLQDDGDRQLTA